MDYAAGFYISDDKATKLLGYQHVVLIRKLRPDWQAGRLNAVGGKLERGETPNQAMAREFVEETGVATEPSDWKKFATLRVPSNLPHQEGKDAVVHFFRAFGDPLLCKTTTDEKILVLPVNVVRLGQEKAISNLQWLMPLALDKKILPVDISYRAPDTKANEDNA